MSRQEVPWDIDLDTMDTDDDAQALDMDTDAETKTTEKVLIEHLRASKAYALGGGGEAHVMEIVTRAPFSKDERLCNCTRTGMTWITEDDTDLFTAIPAFATSVDCVSPRADGAVNPRLRGVLRFALKSRTAFDGTSILQETAQELYSHLTSLGLTELMVATGARGLTKAAFFCPHNSFDLFCITNYASDGRPDSALHAAAVLAGARCSNVSFGVLDCAPPFVNSSSTRKRASGVLVVDLRPAFLSLVASSDVLQRFNGGEAAQPGDFYQWKDRQNLLQSGASEDAASFFGGENRVLPFGLPDAKQILLMISPKRDLPIMARDEIITENDDEVKKMKEVTLVESPPNSKEEDHSKKLLLQAKGREHVLSIYRFVSDSPGVVDFLQELLPLRSSFGLDFLHSCTNFGRFSFKRCDGIGCDVHNKVHPYITDDRCGLTVSFDIKTKTLRLNKFCLSCIENNGVESVAFTLPKLPIEIEFTALASPFFGCAPAEAVASVLRHLTEVGDTRLIPGDGKLHLSFIPTIREWWYCDNGVWTEGGHTYVLNLLQKWVHRELSAFKYGKGTENLCLYDSEVAKSLGGNTAVRYTAALKVVEQEYIIPDFERNMNANPDFMLTQDGMLVDVALRKVRKPTHHDNLSAEMCMNVSYSAYMALSAISDLTEVEDLINRFVRVLMNKNTDAAGNLDEGTRDARFDALMALFAVIASGDPALLKRVVFMASKSDSGKSSIIHAVRSMYGSYVYEHTIEKLNEAPNNNPSPDKIMAGKSRVVMCGEALTPFDIHGVGALKGNTGGDAGPRQRQLFSKKMVETCNHAQLWVVSNKRYRDLVVESERCESVARRLLNIPMFTKLKAASQITDANPLDLPADTTIRKKFERSSAPSWLFFHHVWPWIGKDKDELDEVTAAAGFQKGYSHGGSNRELEKLLDDCMVTNKNRSCNSRDVYKVIKDKADSGEMPRLMSNELQHITEEQCAEMMQTIIDRRFATTTTTHFTGGRGQRGEKSGAYDTRQYTGKAFYRAYVESDGYTGQFSGGSSLGGRQVGDATEDEEENIRQYADILVIGASFDIDQMN